LSPKLPTLTFFVFNIIIQGVCDFYSVVPAELLNFFQPQTTHKTAAFNVAVAVGNLLQALNFSVNFVLYSAVNTYFR